MRIDSSAVWLTATAHTPGSSRLSLASQLSPVCAHSRGSQPRILLRMGREQLQPPPREVASQFALREDPPTVLPKVALPRSLKHECHSRGRQWRSCVTYYRCPLYPEPQAREAISQRYGLDRKRVDRWLENTRARQVAQAKAEAEQKHQ